MLTRYVALDLEMTGLNASRDRILEIGAVRVAGNRIEAEYQQLVNPQRNLPESVVKLTGITDIMASQGVEAQEALRALIDFSQGLPLVAHNISFDYSFLKQCAMNHDISFAATGLDTLRLSRKLLPQLEKKTLEYLCDYFKIDRKQNHRALEDAKAAAALLEVLREMFEKEKPAMFIPVPLVYQAKKQGSITPRQKKYLKELADYHRIELQVNMEGLTRNEASRLTDKILSRYGRPNSC